ncbi:MAG: IclR family transcriptional regulator [Haloferacaceae archaeon]
MSSRDESGTRVRSVDRAFDIIECLQALGGGRVTDVAESLDMAKSTVHGHLATLESRRYVVKEGDTYHVGLRFLNAGTAARARRDIYPVVKRKIKRLASDTGERVQFMLEEHGRGIHVVRYRGHRSVRTDARIGDPRYLHTNAAGKSILAHLPETRVDAIVDRWGLPALTERTITDRAELDERLATVRERGYATNREERIEGLEAVGAPVLDANGRVLGAVSVSGPARRIDDDAHRTEIRSELLGVVDEIELDYRT